MAAKSASSGKEKLMEEEEEVLQAVILADSFNKRFRPLTTRKPRCLLPICNAPLLDWTFESLALAGVQEVFVICRSHAELVKEAIKESKWSKPGSGMKIVPIMTAKETFSPGDAMRDIYTRGLVTSDFVLVMGDLVSNIRIDEVVRVHKERRKTNKDAIMTMVVKESGEKHRTRPLGESSVFVLDPETSECLHYEHLQGYPKTKYVKIPREILATHPEVDIRNDLLDCSIDVCSVEVPSLFQDNFDYLDIRRDFVRGILTSDILMKNIYCYVAEEGYAARVQDTRSYESISKDILSRWTFPLVPDDNHPGGHFYEHTRGNRYIAKDNTVVLARTCHIGTNTLIGSSTTVAENVSITASVIGQNCRIGAGSTIRNSYIFENAVVGEGCNIERSIIGAGVNIKDRTTVPKGCLIGEGVVVGPDATLQPFERLSVRRNEADVEADEDDDDSDIEEVEANQDSIDLLALGKDTNAILWPRGAPADEGDDDEGPENFKNQRFMRLGETASELEASGGELSSSDSDSDTDSDDSDIFDMHDRESLSGMSDVSMTMQLNPLDGGAGGLMADAEFRTEVTQSLERAFAENHSVDNAAVELKTLRMASNVPLTRVKEAVVSAIVEKIPLVEGDPAAQRKEIAAVVGRWGELINLIGGIDPVETVSILQAHCASSARMPLFGQILAALYQEDIVEEDDIRAWHALPESKSGANDGGFGNKPDVELENANKCWMIGAAMIQQFDAQASDSESEEDEREEEAKTTSAQAKAGQKPAESSDADTSSAGDSDSEEEEEEAKPTPKIAAAAPPKFLAEKSAAVSASAEYTDAESEEEEENKPAPAAKTVAPSSASTSVSSMPAALISEESTDESESEAEVQKDGATKDAPKTSEEASSSKSAAPIVASAESTDDESEAEDKAEQATGAAPQLAVAEKAPTTSAVAAKAVAPGAESVESTDNESEEAETKSSSAPATTTTAPVKGPSRLVTAASVESTDNESDEPEPPTPSAKAKAPARDRAATVTPLSKVAGVAAALAASSAAAAAATASAESTDDSESEAEAPAKTQPAPAPSKLASVVAVAAESTDESESEAEAPVEAPPPTAPAPSKLASSVAVAESTDESDSEEEAKKPAAPSTSTSTSTSASLAAITSSKTAPAPDTDTDTDEDASQAKKTGAPKTASAALTGVSLAEPRTAPPIIGSSEDESDDGMSDAVSASEGTSSANPSTNVSEDEDEGDDGELSD